MRITLLLVILLFLPILSWAQQAEQEPPEGLTAEDIKVLSQAVEALRESFEGEAQPNAVTSAPTQQAPVQSVPQKSMADVADKIVDLGARAIAQAAGTVEKVAPEVWRIMIRQQYAKALGLLIVPTGLFLISCFAWLKTKPMRIQLRESGDESGISTLPNAGEHVWGGYILPLCGIFVFGIWFLNRLADSALFLINPEYYAFRDLFIMILNKGQGL